MRSENAPARAPSQSDPHADVIELTPLIRSVLARRVRDSDTVDDLAQETLARIIAVRPRIRDDGLAAYAVVTARNLAQSMGRAHDASRRHQHRLIDLREPPTPEEEALRNEEAVAVSAALANLSPREKRAVVARELGGRDTASVAREMGSTPGGVAVQLARARAKLRVDYLLALERAQPPTPVCRRVLVALSAGDRRRQAALDAGDHLLRCDHCAALSESVLQRRRPLALIWPLGLVHRIGDFMGSKLPNPQAQIAAVTAGAVVVASAFIVGNLVGEDPRPAPSLPVDREASGARGGRLTLPGDVRLPVSPSRLQSHVGERLNARNVAVQSVVADEGFWIGPDRRRVFARLTGRTESPFEVKPGRRVTFVGKVVAHGPRFAVRMGVTRPEGAPALRRQALHIEIARGSVRFP